MYQQPIIEVNNLCKQYVTDAGILPVLKNVNLTVMPGEFVALMGPSGSGKTTFMNIIGCLDLATSGWYFLAGEFVFDVAPDQLAGFRNRLIGFVFQGYNLLPRLTAAENVALPLVYSGWSGAERQERAIEMLGKVGLSRFAAFYPNQLSGGQQQRVAIARALANRAPLILADEPTGNLDTATSAEIMALFRELSSEDGVTIVLVTHDPAIAQNAQRLVNFRDGQVTDASAARWQPLQGHARA